jgi:hypothetical protein
MTRTSARVQTFRVAGNGSIAQAIANQLRRDVIAYKVPMFFGGRQCPRNSGGPGSKGPSKTPVHMCPRVVARRRGSSSNEGNLQFAGDPLVAFATCFLARFDDFRRLTTYETDDSDNLVHATHWR